MEPLEIQGTPPELAGKLCEEILCQEYWYEGKLVDPANVIFLKFADRWFRLCFDYGVIFWRPADKRPEAHSAPEHPPTYYYPLADLGTKFGLRGKVLEGHVALAVAKGSQVSFRFESGEVLTFRNLEDVTDYCFTSQG